MIKDGGLSFETQLKIEFLPPNIKNIPEKNDMYHRQLHDWVYHL